MRKFLTGLGLMALTESLRGMLRTGPRGVRLDSETGSHFLFIVNQQHGRLDCMWGGMYDRLPGSGALAYSSTMNLEQILSPGVSRMA